MGEMDYKKTLNLPQTDFSMKANLAKKEPEILKMWEEEDIYKLIAKQNQKKPRFILHDGPPYANGDIHAGTAFNKILKDIIVKYKSMSENSAPFVPGWDCHGQPIEHQVEKQLGEKINEITQAELREKCKDYALDFVDRQREQFKRLGVMGTWAKPYLTLDYSYEATNIRVFRKLYQKGLIYKGKKPIYWCYDCKTALAEAEIEYKDEESPSIYVKFPLTSGSGKKLTSLLQNKQKGRITQTPSMVIWTTTPWTLPANVAVALHPEVDYALVKVGDESFIMAERLVPPVFEELGIENYKIITKIPGAQFENLNLSHPILDTESRVILADFVTLDQGTGCVHIAPGHGEDDYLVGLKYDLPAPMPVDDRGVFDEQAGIFKGKHIFKANPEIIDYLKQKNLLLDSFSITHPYPHCWRCKKSVIFRATEQWFISMDKTGLREEALKAVESVSWIPNWSIQRISSMISERPDWCISRQRSWGVPIPVFYCNKCGKELISEVILKAVEDLFTQLGADSWFEKEAQEILPAGVKCSRCNSEEFSKGTDILDVWFESGVSHFAVLETNPDLAWPADMYVEGSDQHRGWFQSSLLASVGVVDKSPYKTVLTHGFVVDGEGRKMSKSLGNVIDPQDVIEQSGADVLRLWVASADYSSDIAISKEILDRMREAYRRIRNSFRFILGNISDLNYQDDKVEYEDLREIDRWAIASLNRLLEKTNQAYENSQFYRVFQAVYNFCIKELSAFYFDVLKDTLYTEAAKSHARRSAQTALVEILLVLVKVIAPVLAFTAEEIWQQIPDELRKEASVHLASLPQAESKYFNSSLEGNWEKLFEVRNEVLKALEIARKEGVIGDSLESKVKLYVSPKTLEFLKTYESSLPQIFITSQVELLKFSEKSSDKAFISEKSDNLAVLVEKAEGAKCERCWNYSTSVGRGAKHIKLCERCLKVIQIESNK